jgi:hypothetical protein
MSIDSLSAAREAPSYRKTVVGLSILSLVLFAYPILRIGFDFEIDNNEGWDAYFQTRAISGLSLYVTESPLFFNDYPPLSFYLVGAASWLTGDPVLAGRILSVLSLIGIALCCASIVSKAGASRLDAAFSAATCLGLFASFGTDYVGINDPHLLGQFLLLAALALYFRAPPSIASGLGLAALISFGMLTKHNMLAVPLVLSLDLLRRWPARAWTSYFATGFTLAAVTTALLWWIVGKPFFVQVLSGTDYYVDRGFLMTIKMLERLEAPLAVVGLFLFLSRKERPCGLIGAYLALSVILGALLSGGANNDINHFFEVYVALSIGAGLAIHRIGRTFTQIPVAKAATALLINAGVLFYAPLALGRFAVDIAGEMANRERLFQEDVAYVRSMPGTVLCQSFLLCYRAGKPMFFDPFNVSQAISRGDLPPDLLANMLMRHEIPLLQVEDRRQHNSDDAPGKQAMPAFFVHFPDHVFDILDREYKLSRVGLMGRFYVPR